jgi:hypothetical protein
VKRRSAFLLRLWSFERKVTDLAREMATAYPAAVSALVNPFQKIAAANSEAAGFNRRAPAGFYLRGVEESIAGGAKIIEKVVLPVAMPNGVVNAWPPRNNWAADYAESVRAGILNAGLPPTEQERIAEGERVILHAQQMEAGRLRLNEAAEAQARGLVGG